jgi:hypothetical protein
MADRVAAYGGDRPGDYGGDVWAKTGALAVVAAVVSVLETVPDIGPVYAYERTSRSPAKYLELMRDELGRVNGWTVRRRATASIRYDSNIIIRRTHRIEMSAMRGPVDDLRESEIDFQVLLEAVYAAFKVDYTLGEICEQIGQIQIEDVDFIEFSDTLYHVAVLSLECVERDTAV